MDDGIWHFYLLEVDASRGIAQIFVIYIIVQLL